MNFHEKKSNVSLYLSDITLIDQDKSHKCKKIQLYQHASLGRILILDGEIQFIEAWSPLYHELVVHLAAAFIEKVERVLILGGGCFFAAKEVLKYKSVKQVIMIDHDIKVVDLITRNFSHAKEVTRDSRFSLHINDAFEGLRKLEGKFDLIINDSVDLVNYPPLKGSNVFKTLLQYSNVDGVCTDLIYRHIFERRTTQKTVNLFKRTRLNTTYSLITVPEYPGILHLLTIWGINSQIRQDISKPINTIQRQWLNKKGKNPCEYYNPAFLNYYMYLPPYLKKVINEGRNL